MIYNCSKDGVKYAIKKTGTIKMDEQLIVLTVNKKGEHNHLSSFNEIHLSSNDGENSNNGETSTNSNNDSEIPRRLIGKERIKFFAL